MNNVDKEYFRLINLILEKGRVKTNRTGIDTIGVFGEQSKYDVNLNEFPILTTKKVWFKGIVHELLWFLSGSTNIKYLIDNDVHIWDEWAYAKYKKRGVYTDDECWNQSGRGIEVYDQETFINRIKTDAEFAEKWGELGEGTYGGMWRGFPIHQFVQSEDEMKKSVLSRVDQLQKVMDKLKSNPDDRRMIVSAWNPYWVDHCALPPCHCLFHFNTEELTDLERFELSLKMENKPIGWGTISFMSSKDFNPNNKSEKTIMDEMRVPHRRLNCLMYIRSNDIFLGKPFNITSYSLLTAMVAHCVNMVPGILTYTMGDAHIYVNHMEQVKFQLTREPKQLPKLWLNPNVKNIFDFKFEDIKLIGYDSHPVIKGEIAV